MEKQQKKLELLIEEIQGLLNEIKDEQIYAKEDVKKRHKVYMHSFSKLREFNQIADMTNQVFEKRISNIERTFKEKAKQNSFALNCFKSIVKNKDVY